MILCLTCKYPEACYALCHTLAQSWAERAILVLFLFHISIVLHQTEAGVEKHLEPNKRVFGSQDLMHADLVMWNLGRVKYEHQHALAWGSHDSLALALFSKQIFLILSLYQYSEIKLGAIGPNYNYFQLKGYLSHCEATSLSKHCLPLPRTFTQQLVLLSLLV